MSLERSLPDYQPKRFGLRYEPPTIVLEYLVPSTGKLYHHRMRVRNLTASSDPKSILESLKTRHAMYLTTSKIQDGQIEELLGKLKEKIAPSIDYNTYDLNKLNPEEVKQHKQEMDKMFNKNAKTKDDADFIYDTRMDFEVGIEETSWDD